MAPAAAGPARTAADARRRCATSRPGRGALGDALALVDGLAIQRSLVVIVSDFRGPRRLARRRCCVSPAAIPRSRSRSATRASRSSPTSASCGSSTRRPAASCASTRATRGLRDALRRGRSARNGPGSCGCSPRQASATWRSRPQGDWLRPLAAFSEPERQLSFGHPILLVALLGVPLAVCGLASARAPPPHAGRQLVEPGAPAEHGPGLAGPATLHPVRVLPDRADAAARSASRGRRRR